MTQSRYPNEPLFGVSVEPVADGIETMFTVAQIADEHQLDILAVQDHPYIPNYLDAWTLLVSLAAFTKHISVMPNVTNLPLRTPAIVAKAAATLSLLSGGRVELGIEAEYFADQIEAYGGPQRSTAESFAAFEEAISVMGHYGVPMIRRRTKDNITICETLNRDRFRRTPSASGRVRWVLACCGSRAQRAMDGCHHTDSIPPDRIPEMQRRVDSGAHGARRDPALVRRGYNILGIITDAPETRDDNWLVTTPPGLGRHPS